MEEKLRRLESVHKDLAGGHFGVHKRKLKVMKNGPRLYAQYVCSLI